MDWFRRYGIPGAYAMGLVLVWLSIWYPCRIDLSQENTLKIVGGIFVGGFLPFGYLMSLIGQGWYFLCCCLFRRCGRHARARLIAASHTNNNPPFTIDEWATWAAEGIRNVRSTFINLPINTLPESEIVLAPCSVLATVSRKDFGLKGDEFVQEWIRKRTDIVVMNQAIMAGTVLCSIGAFCLCFLSGWSMQPQYHWHWILTSIAVVCLHLIIWYVTIIFRIKIDIAIAGMLNLRQRQSPKKAKMKLTDNEKQGD